MDSFFQSNDTTTFIADLTHLNQIEFTFTNKTIVYTLYSLYSRTTNTIYTAFYFIKHFLFVSFNLIFHQHFFFAQFLFYFNNLFWVTIKLLHFVWKFWLKYNTDGILFRSEQSFRCSFAWRFFHYCVCFSMFSHFAVFFLFCFHSARSVKRRCSFSLDLVRACRVGLEII